MGHRVNDEFWWCLHRRLRLRVKRGADRRRRVGRATMESTMSLVVAPTGASAV